MLSPEIAIDHKTAQQHPDGHEPHPLAPTPANKQLYISGPTLRDEFENLARAKAPGCSGWTEDLLAQACLNDRVAENLAAMVRDIINNEVPPAIREMIATCRLVGIPKPGPTETEIGVRPIAVAESV